MKRIDYFLVRSFIPPFFMAFMIALFVLIMQTFFIYLDEFVGKGLGLFVIVEMVGYLSIKLFPLALAIGVLLASVMVFGNMGEKYELSSLKSAGVSLFRIMASLIVLVTLISMFSYFCNDFLNPKANLQFHSRMWDIRRQKPSLSIEEKMFNNDFFGFSIWIDRKLANGRGIEGILVYNQMDNTNEIDVTTASDGEMFTDPEGNYFIMTLNDGVKYKEQYKQSRDGKLTYPFIRTEFKQFNKAFPLHEFELGSTDQDLFKSHHYMRTSRELIFDIDSFHYKLGNLEAPLDNRFQKLMDIGEPDEEEYRDKVQIDDVDFRTIPDSVASTPESAQLPKKIVSENKLEGEIVPRAISFDQMGLEETEERITPYTQPNIITDIYDFERQFSKGDQRAILSIAATSVRNLQYEISKSISEEKRLQINLSKFQFELHSKFSLAVACFIFLFIGAPMGAIIRKGGFGYPLLVSIIFFALYIVLTIAMKKMSEAQKLDPVMAAWIPTVFIFAIGLFLTIKARNDSKMMDLDILKNRMVNFVKKISEKRKSISLNSQES